MIRCDITFDEKIITQPVVKTVKSNYPDVKQYKVKVYSIEEILAEKIRSILQRGKSRDYYDVWMLLKVMKFDSHIRCLAEEKCRTKGIGFKTEGIFDEEKLKEAKNFWETGLKDLVRDLPDFDGVIRELKEIIFSR